jgi:transcriptional regulator with XRE-family HTH domain
MLITSEQIRAARAALRWEQADLAVASKVSLPSIKRIESVPGPLIGIERTADALRSALEDAGIEFTNGGHPGIRMKRPPAWQRVIIPKGEFANSGARALIVPLSRAFAKAGLPNDVEVWLKVTGWGDHVYFFSLGAATLIPEELKQAKAILAALPNLKSGFKKIEL